MEQRPPINPAAPSTTSRLLDVASLVVALVLGIAAFATIAAGEFTIGPARLSVQVAPSLTPRTVIELPPFGQVSARTHRGPLALHVRLLEVDVGDTQRMLEQGALSIPSTLGADPTSSLPVRGFGGAAWRVLVSGVVAAATLGGLVALALRRRRSVVVLAIVLAVGVPLSSVAVAYATWDITAFQEPTLSGSLAYAPRLVDVFSERLDAIEDLRAQAAKVAQDVATYYADTRSLGVGGPLEGTYRVLHVTDLHLDPVGAELARHIARSYGASLVIDTGDLPILGAPVESRVFGSLIDTATPRVYVPGNHDSPSSVAELGRLGVTVLETGTVDIDGIRIFGVPDPVSRGFGVEPDAALLATAEGDSLAALKSLIASGEPTPTIVAVHNPAMESAFVGVVPIVLSGHTHKARLYFSEGTVRLNSGTLGGMPYDPEGSGKQALPYSVSVLYFTAGAPRRLIAIDRIAVNANRSTVITRDIVEETALP